MCIIIDTNCLSAVFKKSDLMHDDFEPIENWVRSGKGRVVYGGTKYIRELGKTKYLKMILELKKTGRAIKIDSDAVDRREEEVIGLTRLGGCDDQHIIALVGVSGCQLICSMDARAFPHFKNCDLYPRGVRRPRIYSSKRNENLLCDAFASQRIKQTS